MRDDALLSRRAAEFDPVVHAVNRFAPLVTRAHLALPHPCSWGRPMSHQARGRLKGTQYERLLERARAKERARATADVLYVEQDVAGQHNTCVPFTSEARSHRYHNISTQHHNTTCDKNDIS